MIAWQWNTFDELGPHALYQVLALRQRVFVIEQQCIYPDLDGHDQQAMHLLGLYHVRGYQIPVNHKEARKWFTQAADKGSAGDIYNLG